MSDEPRRLSLLYQLYLTSQASRRLVRLALAETDLSGEEYALCSYLYGNGPRTMTQAARDFGMPISTVATLLAPLVEAGHIKRGAHPVDGRARLLELTAAGRERLERALPDFSGAYRELERQLSEAGVDPETVFEALDELRSAILHATDLVQGERGAPG
jgi:DNA-binding MarR family transcriptional regulator